MQLQNADACNPGDLIGAPYGIAHRIMRAGNLNHPSCRTQRTPHMTRSLRTVVAALGMALAVPLTVMANDTPSQPLLQSDTSIASEVRIWTIDKWRSDAEGRVLVCPHPSRRLMGECRHYQPGVINEVHPEMLLSDAVRKRAGAPVRILSISHTPGFSGIYSSAPNTISVFYEVLSTR
jgi:hypothetical protein